jgi:hypothetical protein
MLEDKALRDASLALVKADLAKLKTDFNARSLGSRFLDRMEEGAIDVYEEAVDLADNNRGVLATLIAAVFIWFARHPIMALFGDGEHDDGDERRQSAEPDGASARSE